MDTKMKIVDSVQTKSADRGFAIAAILQALASFPVIAWAMGGTLLLGVLSWVIYYKHDSMGDFTDSVLFWLNKGLLVVTGILALVFIYKVVERSLVLISQFTAVRVQHEDLRRKRETTRKAILTNEALEIENANKRLIPSIIKYGIDAGMGVDFEGVKITDYRSNLHTLQMGIEGQQQAQIAGPPVQTFRQLMQAGIIQEALSRGEICHGFVNGQLRFGTWKQVGSCGIGGISGSGKTTTVRFYLFQALLQKNARFIMIDPAIADVEESLAAQFIRFKHVHLLPPCGLDMSAIEYRLQWLYDELTRRMTATPGIKGPPIFLIIDEFNQLARRAKREDGLLEKLQDLVLEIGQSGRKFGIFCLLIGQRWSDNDLGGKGVGCAIRDSLATFMVHRFNSEDQADRLAGSKYGSDCTELPDGYNLFRIVDGGKTEMVTKVTPNTVMDDGDLILKELGTVVTESNTPEVPVYRPAMREQIAQHVTQPLHYEDRAQVSNRPTVPMKPELKIVPRQNEQRVATLTDAVEVWNAFRLNNPGKDIGRGKLREELMARNLVCSDDRAKTLVKNIKERENETSGGVGGVVGGQ